MEQVKQRNYQPIVWILTIAINALVVIAFFLPKLDQFANPSFGMLPAVNATLNGMTFITLLAALYAIKQKNIVLHKRLVFLALTWTGLFLVTYLAYHFTMPSTKYGGDGPLKYVYFFILLTHIVLAAAIVPLALTSIARGLNMSVEKHRKIARWTMPIWLYVAATGVVVYLMISPYYQH